jgi:hypothetical protein
MTTTLLASGQAERRAGRSRVKSAVGPNEVSARRTRLGRIAASAQAPEAVETPAAPDRVPLAAERPAPGRSRAPGRETPPPAQEQKGSPPAPPRERPWRSTDELFRSMRFAPGAPSDNPLQRICATKRGAPATRPQLVVRRVHRRRRGPGGHCYFAISAPAGQSPKRGRARACRHETRGLERPLGAPRPDLSDHRS